MESHLTNQRFKFLFEKISDGFLEIDPSGSILTTNPAASEMTGRKSDELKGLLFQTLLGHHSFSDLLQKERGTLYRKDGAPCSIAYTSTPLHNKQGDIQAYLWLLRNLEKLVQYAEYDTLTELPNRTLLYKLLSKNLANATRYHYGVTLLIIDLDHFKRVNDTFGFQIGDKLIQQTALRLLDCVRKGDLIARTEADEFVIVLENSDARSVAAVAQKILTHLEEPFHIEERDLYTSASIGIAMFPHHADGIESLVKAGNTALHSSKAKGRNQYQFFTSELNKQVSDRIILENHLRQAIKRNEFSLHYQPKIEVATDEMVGAEALLRWHNWELGEVSPLHFIPIAEETGFIHPLGEWVIRTCCQQSKLWQKMKLIPSNMIVSVNLSMQQLNKHDLPSVISSILEETGYAPHQLEIELTESTLMNNPDKNISLLDNLKQLGLSISVDDFGTGYSCLSYLKRLPINILKIDRSFIHDIFRDPNDAIIASTIIKLSHGLGLRVIAEGVETENQLEFLRENHCDWAQGFYFSKPLPFGQFTKLLSDDPTLKHSNPLSLKGEGTTLPEL